MNRNAKQKGKLAATRVAGRSVVVLALIAVVIAAGYLLNRHIKARDNSASEQPGEGRRTPVVTTQPVARDFERSLVVQGNLEAKNFAIVSPRIPGVINTVFVDEGDSVIANETKLFETDAVALKENAQIGRHNLRVAQYARKEAEANLEKREVDLHKAELDYNRFKRLLEDKQAVTADAFEQQKSRYEQLLAAEKLDQAKVDLAAAQEDQAKASLAIAEKNLADATIYAPLSGRVSERLKEPGEMGNPGQPVLRIVDTSLVEVSAFLPVHYYASVVPGRTEMRIHVGNIDLGRQVITYKSPTINPKLRTFEVKCLLKDPPEGVVPGAMAQIAVVLERRRGLAVPSRAIEERGGRSVVFVVKNAAAHQVPVRTGIENAGWTEILDSTLTEEAPVITMGQYLVEEGTPVSVQQEEK